jgi:phosphoglycolate phosphatase
VKYKNILFDLDGTLIDSAPGIEESFFYAYKQIYKIDCPKNIRKLIGPPIDQVLVLINGEKNSSIINKFVEEFKCHYDNAGYKNSLLFDGVLNILEILSLNKNVKTFLVTNKRYKPTKLLLKYFLIEKYFCEICCPDSLEVKFTNKTDLVGNLLIRQGLRQNETILIGVDDLTALVKRSGDDHWIVQGKSKVHILKGMPDQQLVHDQKINFLFG